MASGNRALVLVVEDDPELREGLCEVLRLEGYQVEAAAQGAAALERLSQSWRSLPAAIVLDMMMPEVNGWEVLQAMRAWGGDVTSIPVIVLTAAIHLDVDASPPVLRVLHKPFHVPDLVEALEACGVERTRP